MAKVFVANHESETIHVGEEEGRSTKFDPRCNVPTARSEGKEGTEDVSTDKALDLVNAGYAWCDWCRS